MDISNGREITHNFEKKTKNDCDLHASGLASTLETAWNTFRAHNAMKRAFNRRNISNGREISLNYRQNRRMIAICVFLRMFRCAKSRAPCSARIIQWKQRFNVVYISNEWEISLNYRKNRGMIAICVRLVSSRRWKSRELRSARIMLWKEHLIVEISQPGVKYRLIIDKIDEWLRFACVWSRLDAGNRMNYVPHA